MFGRLLYLPVCLAAVFTLTVADEFKHDYEAYNNAKFGVYPDNKHTGSNTKSPVLQITTWDKEAVSPSGSHIFIRHNGQQDVWGNQDATPLILDANDLTAVYVNRSFPIVFNVRVQENWGKKYLTFYGDKLVDFGLGDGFCHVYDTSYREVYKVAAQNLKVKADLHECELTGYGTAIVSAYETGLSRAPQSLKGKKRPILIREGIFQEIDLETNEALFTWRASEHVDIYDSYEGHGTNWDFFHINTVEKTEDGNYLISARHMHSIYLVNGQTGDIMWTLGGLKNEFVELAPEEGVYSSNPVLTFAWQHHSRFYRSGRSDTGGKMELTFFDNHLKEYNEVGCKENCSRGLHIRLDTQSNPKTVQLVREYQHPTGLISQSQGSMQILDNGNVFIGWGRMPSFTEHLPDGKAVLDVQFSPWYSKATMGKGLDNYRAFKQDWKATPYWPPHVAVKTKNGVATAYVSWNGATEVKEWVLFASDSVTDLNGAGKVVARVPRSGFETTVPLGNLTASCIRAEAIDGKNRVLGSTSILSLMNGTTISMDTENVAVIDDTDDADNTDDADDTSDADDTDDTEDTTEVADDTPNLMVWDVLKEGREWRTVMGLFALLGMGLSVCCLVYAFLLNRRDRLGEPRYSPL